MRTLALLLLIHTCLGCQPCDVDEQYTLRPCDATHAAECGNCTVCGENEYEARSCDATHNTECRSCSQCAAGVTFAVGMCGPESDRDVECRACSRCAVGEFEARPCDPTHDTVCGQTTTPTLLSLSLSSDLPASAFTPDMLSALGNAFASALHLPPSAVEVLGIRRRRVLLADLTVELRIHALVQTEQINSIDLAAVATTSGLPIVIRSVVAIPSITPTPPPPTPADKNIPIALAVVGAIIGFAALTALVVVARRPQRRVADDNFSDLDLASATIAHGSPRRQHHRHHSRAVYHQS